MLKLKRSKIWYKNSCLIYWQESLLDKRSTENTNQRNLFCKLCKKKVVKTFLKWQWGPIVLKWYWRVVYLEKTASLFAHLVVPKSSQVWKYFFDFMTQKCTRSINEIYRYSLCLFLQILEASLIIATFRMFYIQICFIQYRSSPELLWLYEIFSQSVYGWFRWTVAVRRSTPVHLGEPV